MAITGKFERAVSSVYFRSYRFSNTCNTWEKFQNSKRNVDVVKSI